VTSRFLPASVVFALALSGCSDTAFTGPLAYSQNDKLTVDLSGKPKLQAAVTKAVERLFGSSPNEMKVPKGSSLPDGGRRLGSEWHYEGKRYRYYLKPKEKDAPHEYAESGYALYRRHCLHCHGLSGDGNGPTAPFLYPRPRDYRPGVFKFTSTTSNKPTRADLRKTIMYGLHGTSMPAFIQQMSADEIERVIDYVIFLSARGETELGLIGEAGAAEEKDADAAVNDEVTKGIAQTVFENWKQAETQVEPPRVSRTENTRQSILRGRQLFLGQTKEKLECAGCHGATGVGDGLSFVKREVFQDVVFRGQGPERRKLYDELSILERITSQVDPAQGKEWVPVKELPATIDSTKGFGRIEKLPIAQVLEGMASRGWVVRDRAGGAERVKPAYKPDSKTAKEVARIKAERDLWIASLDVWDNPLRPADLNLGIYKGGRRPIDLYWRVAKGINGVKMPAHAQTFPQEPERLWDIVNFVLALPYQPELLKGATAAPPASAPPATVARK
jgi:mono/diheme cytochrome c family protein